MNRQVEAQRLYQIGNALASQGKIVQAILNYERALSLRPDYAEAHCNLGNARALQGQTDRAILHYERALSLRPDYAEAHCNLGNARALQGQTDRAILHYERALSLRPDYAEVYSNLLFTMNYAYDKDPADIFNAHLTFAKRWETPLVPSIEATTNDRRCQRRLRIGYVSSDFRQHAVCYFIEPVLVHHDREWFEIYCYANHLQDDAVTERLKLRAAHWRNIFGHSDEQTAQQIRADQIDILVDLNGHTSNNRLLLFARKPAPIQATWLGYPNTTGLSAMDYRITDGFADPLGLTEHLHSEKLVRLPECFSCYQPPPDAPEVSGLPAQKKGFVTFGCFNNMAKITPEVRAVWARILQALPGSRLAIKNTALSGECTREMVRQTFKKMGITPERLELLARDQSQRAHLDRYRNIDIGLDTFPYNGTTTTCEALWMGVPVITLAGKTHAGRVGVSQMSSIGLTELVSNTLEEYVSVAQRLAGNLDRLGIMRAELRSRLATSPLTNGHGFTINLEMAYRNMWQNWCRHELR
jgi:protein O-GlcNAc transferase